jgi:hypothetical protein
MPEHVHLLITPQEAALERVVGMIKGGFSHRIGSKSSVWQRGFTDRRARDRDEFLSFRNDIHQNPVKERLCANAEHYKWSSAWSGWSERLRRRNIEPLRITSAAKASVRSISMARLKPCP